MEKIIKEYYILFLENTEMYNMYNGEYITEDKEQADEVFEENKKEVEQYYSKEWLEKDIDDYIENEVEVFYRR